MSSSFLFSPCCFVVVVAHRMPLTVRVACITIPCLAQTRRSAIVSLQTNICLCDFLFAQPLTGWETPDDCTVFHTLALVTNAYTVRAWTLQSEHAFTMNQRDQATYAQHNCDNALYMHINKAQARKRKWSPAINEQMPFRVSDWLEPPVLF